MKKIIALIIAAAVICGLFAACGKPEQAPEQVRDELTTAMEDMTTVLEEASRDVSEFADELTENGNVTDQTGEGALEQGITDLSEALEGDEAE